MKIREQVIVQLPKRKNHQTCRDCRKADGKRYMKCLGPCTWLISALSHEARQAILKATVNSSWR